MKKYFFLLLLISYPCHATDSDCGYVNPDFHISLLGHSLCCDREAQECRAKKVSLTLWEEKTPKNPKTEANRVLSALENPAPEITVFHCADHKKSLRILQRKGDTFVFQFTNRTTLKFYDSKTPRFLKRDLVRTFCQLDPLSLFRNTSASAISNNQALTPSNTTNNPVEKEIQEASVKTNPNSTTATSKQTPSATGNTLQNRQTPLANSNATYMLDTNFYRQPTPGNLSSVREFATADKQQVLKINFTSDDKEPFLQKLQKQFAQEPYKITSCKNNIKLFEVQTNPYQVFILSSNAVSVLIKPTGYPATAALRKQLCNFNAALAW